MAGCASITDLAEQRVLFGAPAHDLHDCAAGGDRNSGCIIGSDEGIAADAGATSARGLESTARIASVTEQDDAPDRILARQYRAGLGATGCDAGEIVCSDVTPTPVAAPKAQPPYDIGLARLKGAAVIRLPHGNMPFAPPFAPWPKPWSRQQEAGAKKTVPDRDRVPHSRADMEDSKDGIRPFTVTWFGIAKDFINNWLNVHNIHQDTADTARPRFWSWAIFQYCMAFGVSCASEAHGFDEIRKEARSTGRLPIRTAARGPDMRHAFAG